MRITILETHPSQKQFSSFMNPAEQSPYEHFRNRRSISFEIRQFIKEEVELEPNIRRAEDLLEEIDTFYDQYGGRVSNTLLDIVRS